jgi:hypothetical protein
LRSPGGPRSACQGRQPSPTATAPRQRSRGFRGFPEAQKPEEIAERKHPLSPSSSALLPPDFPSASPRLHYQRGARGSRARRSWTEQERGGGTGAGRAAAAAAPPRRPIRFPPPYRSSGRLIVAAVGARSPDRRRDAPPAWPGHAPPSPFPLFFFFTLSLLLRLDSSGCPHFSSLAWDCSAGAVLQFVDLQFLAERRVE